MCFEDSITFNLTKKRYIDSFFSFLAVIERFQLLIFCLWLFWFNAKDYGAFNLDDFWVQNNHIVIAIAVVYASEVAVDWLKHSAICNSNSIYPIFYSQTSAKIAYDIKRFQTKSVKTHFDQIFVATYQTISS